MTHTVCEKAKLLARVRRIRGQVETMERALEAEAGCEKVMHLIASTRAAMAEVVDDHMRTHLPEVRSKVMPEFAVGTKVPDFPVAQRHAFQGEGHEHAERRTWAVTLLCGP